ncbi:tetratricopeptide repeat protein [Flammeovirga kamogawensis]|uniref:Tetratricopeptide repeat protein n=1 Tax=Flammeovirga kamogawensis TaxID=373891 RepID=A0ABX8GSM8_9BACT|nr:hypothetical protein [Flammeovirga kamogawensis]MBB6461409.1 tetratricopeptide (TPR) repeat protein [Flammeovirga kamogawensis]QWG06308.1 hypothetical protein KM029_13310 [Flammeovirga kamogawensis]TRX68137.1 hypothetical protein EO216_08325 [Flammeovirga kamogawensis]
MLKYHFILIFILISLFGCKKEQDTLEGLVDATAHEDEFFDKQLSFLDKLVSNDPDNPELYFSRGSVQLRKKEFGSALEDAEKAIQIDSTNGEFYFLGASSHYFLGNMRSAISSGEKAISLGYKHPHLKTFIGASFNNLGQPDSALFYLKSSVLEVPQNNMTYRSIGHSYALKGDFERSLKNYQRSIEILPTDTLSYVGIIEQSIKSKNIPLAKETLTIAIGLQLQSTAINYENAFLLASEGFIDSAIVIHKSILKEKPTYWKSSKELGRLYRKKRLPLEANRVFLEGLKLDPEVKELWYELGLTQQYFFKNYTEAKKDFEKALDIDPLYKDAKVALSNLRATLRRLYAPPVITTEESSESESQAIDDDDGLSL